MGGDLLSITDAADDGKGPFLDLCTYENAGTAPQRRPPARSPSWDWSGKA